MRIVFMGTPDFAVPVLQKLLTEHEVVAVYTRAPKESGRGKKINKTPVHLLAESHQIPVHTPRSLKSEEEQAILKSYSADVGIVAAYGLLLPQAVLDMFPRGCINVHASLLPRWRGAAPIQRAIEARDDKSGISIMQMALALDAGDVLAQDSITITPNMTGGKLHDALSVMGADLLAKTLNNLDNIHAVKQDEKYVTYAEKLSKEECLIDFCQPVAELEAKIRAFAPYPSMYFLYKGERFKVLEVTICESTGNAGEIIEGQKELIIAANGGALRILTLQRQGKQAMSIQDMLRGFTFEKETLLNN